MGQTVLHICLYLMANLLTKTQLQKMKKQAKTINIFMTSFQYDFISTYFSILSFYVFQYDIIPTY